MCKNMKKVSLLVLAAVVMTGCWTSIHTVAPTDEVVVPVRTVYTTTVTTPTPRTTTVNTFTVTSYNTDLSFYLDLNAVAAAFAESRSVQEFEQILNSSKYMINNLDINCDGWVDYLRVIETHRGLYHTLLIQACLGPSSFQDVATIVAERRSDRLYVEVIGDRWLYGSNYIVRPVFVHRPPLWDVYGRSVYNPWVSPYYHGYWPSYYTRPKPIYLNHYQAYVNTYMHNHHYCNYCDYPPQPYYNGYTSMTQPHSHNDYATQHPNDSFEGRVGHSGPTTSGVTVRNAGDLRTEVTRQSGNSSTSSQSRPTTSTSTTTSGSSRRTGETTSSTSASKPNSPSSSTVTKQTTSTVNTTSRTGTSVRGESSTSTSSASSTSTTTSKSTTSNTTSRTTSTVTSRPSTSIETRVNKSGTTRTTVKTTDATGRTQTVKRETSTTSSRSSEGSVRSSQGSSSGSSPRSSRR